jgi:DNA (cytosine-5)-methyltransferase 1
MIENVTELTDWALFPMWKACLEKLGYAIDVHVLDSADFGVAQNRIRVIIIGVLGKTPLGLKFEKEKPASFLDIYIENSGKWSFVEKKGRAAATLARVKNGREQFGDFFVMPYYGSGSGKTGRSVNRPIGTITTIDRWAVVKGDMMRMLSAEEYRKGMSFPDGFIYPKVKREAVFGFGNATCPLKITKIVQKIKENI